MPFLDQLDVCAASQARDRTPVGRFRSRLAAAIGTQIELAIARREGRPLTITKKLWRKTGPNGEKVLTDVVRRVRPWWWSDEAGRIFLSLKNGPTTLELAPGKSAVEVTDASTLQDTLQLIRKAVVAGELDRCADTISAAKARSTRNKGTSGKSSANGKSSDKA